MEVRSYRRVFDLERRIYRVDSLRLNPGGVPVRGVVYVLAVLAIVLIASRLPFAGPATRMLPWFARYLAIPGLTGALLAIVRIEGRPFHLAAFALLRHRIGLPSPTGMRAARRELAEGLRWSPPPVLMLADGCDVPRRVRYTGPGALLVSVHTSAKPGAARSCGWACVLTCACASSRTASDLPMRGRCCSIGRRA